MRMLLIGLAVILVLGSGCEPMLMARIPQRIQDGVRYNATALSWNQNKTHHVQVEFSGNKATIYFMDGKSKVLTLRNPEKDRNSKKYRAG